MKNYRCYSVKMSHAALTSLVPFVPVASFVVATPEYCSGTALFGKGQPCKFSWMCQSYSITKCGGLLRCIGDGQHAMTHQYCFGSWEKKLVDATNPKVMTHKVGRGREKKGGGCTWERQSVRTTMAFTSFDCIPWCMQAEQFRSTLPDH